MLVWSRLAKRKTMSKNAFLKSKMTANIILFGGKNSGKTTVLKILYLLLGGKNPKDLTKAPNINRCAITTKGGYTIGFAWGGDSLEIVEDNVEFFTLHSCDIAFSPTHVGGVTVLPMDYFIDKNISSVENIIWKRIHNFGFLNKYEFKNDDELLNVAIWEREFPESYAMAQKLKGLLDSGFFD